MISVETIELLEEVEGVEVEAASKEDPEKTFKRLLVHLTMTFQEISHSEHLEMMMISELKNLEVLKEEEVLTEVMIRLKDEIREVLTVLEEGMIITETLISQEVMEEAKMIKIEDSTEIMIIITDEMEETNFNKIKSSLLILVREKQFTILTMHMNTFHC